MKCASPKYQTEIPPENPITHSLRPKHILNLVLPKEGSDVRKGEPALGAEDLTSQIDKTKAISSGVSVEAAHPPSSPASEPSGPSHPLALRSETQQNTIHNYVHSFKDAHCIPVNFGNGQVGGMVAAVSDGKNTFNIPLVISRLEGESFEEMEHIRSEEENPLLETIRLTALSIAHRALRGQREPYIGQEIFKVLHSKPKYQSSRTELASVAGGSKKPKFRSILEYYSTGSTIWSGSLALNVDTISFGTEFSGDISDHILELLRGDNGDQARVRFIWNVPVKICKGFLVHKSGKKLASTDWEK